MPQPIPGGSDVPGWLYVKFGRRLPLAGLCDFLMKVDMKHRRRRRRLVQKDYTKTCAWCLRTIPEEHERFGFGAKATPGVDLSGVEGTMIEIQLVRAGK